MFPLLKSPRGLVNRFNVGPLTVRRTAARVQNSRGGWDEGAETVFEINPVAAHVLQGRDLLQVPEADRNSEVVQFYGRASSFPTTITDGFRSADSGFAPDVVEYRGREYLIIQVQDYDPQGDVWIAHGKRKDGNEP